MFMASIAIFSFYSGVVERGVETFAYEISKRLASKHQISLILAGKFNSQKFKVMEISVLAVPPKSSKGIFGKLYLDWQSAKILIFTVKSIPAIFKEKYKLVIPLNGGWQVVILRIISKLIGAKLIIPGGAGIGSDDAWNLLFRPDVFVALTTAQADWAKKLVPEVKIVSIPNGVDLEMFNSLAN